jgi:hypothetical protein
MDPIMMLGERIAGKHEDDAATTAYGAVAISNVGLGLRTEFAGCQRMLLGRT